MGGFFLSRDRMTHLGLWTPNDAKYTDDLNEGNNAPGQDLRLVSRFIYQQDNDKTDPEERAAVCGHSRLWLPR